MIRINVQPMLSPGMAAGPDAKEKLHSHERSLLPSEARCSAPHGSPSAGRNAQRRAGVPTSGGLSVLSACRVPSLEHGTGLGSEAPSALNLKLPGAVPVTASRLWPSVSSISNCDPSREACRASFTPSLLGSSLSELARRSQRPSSLAERGTQTSQMPMALPAQSDQSSVPAWHPTPPRVRSASSSAWVICAWG